MTASLLLLGDMGCTQDCPCSCQDSAPTIHDGATKDGAARDGAKKRDQSGTNDLGDLGDLGALPDSPSGGGCGYKGLGTPQNLTPNLKLCLPQVVCTSETCPPPVGSCVAGHCVHQGAYHALATLKEAWATYYCDLLKGGCHGVTQAEFAEVTAQKVAQRLALPLCDNAAPTAKCVGIAASSPLLVGNSQEAKDPQTGKPVALWGLGYTEASGLCYELEGPGGTVVVALTDRCGGYCSCKGSGMQECGPCVSAADMSPNCPCVGTVPGLFPACCGLGCGQTKGNCDWCASNNHPHFDLDTTAFHRLCGAQASQGSCKLTKVHFIPCFKPETIWPPGGGSTSCKKGSFQCAGPEPHHAQVPGTGCCCNWDLTPQTDGTCA